MMYKEERQNLVYPRTGLVKKVQQKGSFEVIPFLCKKKPSKVKLLRANKSELLYEVKNRSIVRWSLYLLHHKVVVVDLTLCLANFALHFTKTVSKSYANAKGWGVEF